MKNTLIALAILMPMTCFGGETPLQLLKNDAKLSGIAIVWDLEQDYLLETEQLKAVNAVPMGQTVQLAATIVELASENAFKAGVEPDEYPVAYSCAQSKSIFFTTASRNDLYQKLGCDILNKPSA